MEHVFFSFQRATQHTRARAHTHSSVVERSFFKAPTPARTARDNTRAEQVLFIHTRKGDGTRKHIYLTWAPHHTYSTETRGCHVHLKWVETLGAVEVVERVAGGAEEEGVGEAGAVAEVEEAVVAVVMVGVVVGAEVAVEEACTVLTLGALKTFSHFAAVAAAVVEGEAVAAAGRAADSSLDSPAEVLNASTVKCTARTEVAAAADASDGQPTTMTVVRTAKTTAICTATAAPRMMMTMTARTIPTWSTAMSCGWGG